MKKTVFLSFSHKDETWKDRLVTHLGVLAQQDLLEVWDDRRIGAGLDWYQEIEAAMTRASVALLLISADFLTSNFILREEVPRLLERRQKEGLRIIPVLLKPCAWKQVPWLSPVQFRPKDATPISKMSRNELDTALASLAEEVWTILATTMKEAAHTAFIPLLPEKISLAKMPATSPELFGRDAELLRLDAAWEDPTINILCLIGFGGTGKTALINRWLLNLARDNFRGAARVLGWSFYSQGALAEKPASAEPFIDFALRWFDDTDSTVGSAWEKGERLAELVKGQRTILVLDGLEPLQYPPGEMGGRLRDPGLSTLLRELAHQNPGLCLVTTRLAVEDLKTFKGTTVTEIELANLTPEAGAQLLAHLNVKGPTAELEQAARDFDGHALALNLLGSYLAVAFQGDVRRRDQISDLIVESRWGVQASWVMAYYEDMFAGKPELEILYLMGLFNQPAEARTLSVLRAAPAIPGLTEKLSALSSAGWSFAVHTLREVKVLAKADSTSPDTLDCHPLVRGYFGERLKHNNPEAWRQAHSRLFEYFQKTAKEYPDTLEEMLPLYRAVAHGCQAGRAQEALEKVYWQRILRKNKSYSTHKLGVFGADLDAMANFFEVPWKKPLSNLTEPDQAFVLSRAGFLLRALGRLAEAEDPLRESLEADILRNDWQNAARTAANLAELHLIQGQLAQALEAAHQALDLAQRSGNAYRIMDNTTKIATVLHQMGRLPEAEAIFRQAEEMQKQVQPEYPFLYSLRGFQYCDLLLDQGRYQEVRERAEITLVIATRNNWLMDIAQDHLILGRAYHMQTLAEVSGNFIPAASHLNQAVQGLRQAGALEFLLPGLLARAALYRLTDNFPQAQKDLDEALSIAIRNYMRLYRVDGHLEATRLHISQANLNEARVHLNTAKKMIKVTGYHRRDREVAELEKQIQEQP